MRLLRLRDLLRLELLSEGLQLILQEGHCWSLGGLLSDERTDLGGVLGMLLDEGLSFIDKMV